MDLQAKIRSLPASAGVYLYKNAEGDVIYVGKANNLRSRVSSYFREGRWEDAKTDSLVREAVDVDYIVVANNKEALALENHLIKQKKPRFNIRRATQNLSLREAHAGRFPGVSHPAAGKTAARITVLFSREPAYRQDSSTGTSWFRRAEWT
jgi:hypothetical protein